MATEFIQTVKASGGDFSLLSSWEAATQCNLTSAATLVFPHNGINGAIAAGSAVTGATSGATGTVIGVTSSQILLTVLTGTFQVEAIELTASDYVFTTAVGDSAKAVAECDAFICVNNCLINGWTANATNYIIVRAIPGTEHKGVLGAGFRLRKSYGGYKEILEVLETYTRLIDIEVENLSTISSAHAIQVGGANMVLQNVIARVPDTGGSRTCYSQIINGPVTYINCIAFKGAKGFYCSNYDYPKYYNCTAVKGAIGFERASTSGTYPTLKNCVSIASNPYKGSFNASCTNNASSITDAPGSNSVSNVVTTLGVDITDYSGNDFTPVAGGALDGAGIDLSSIFTDDIAGTVRG